MAIFANISGIKSQAFWRRFQQYRQYFPPLYPTTLSFLCRTVPTAPADRLACRLVIRRLLGPLWALAGRSHSHSARHYPKFATLSVGISMSTGLTKLEVQNFDSSSTPRRLKMGIFVLSYISTAMVGIHVLHLFPGPRLRNFVGFTTATHPELETRCFETTAMGNFLRPSTFFAHADVSLFRIYGAYFTKGFYWSLRDNFPCDVSLIMPRMWSAESRTNLPSPTSLYAMTHHHSALALRHRWLGNCILKMAVPFLSIIQTSSILARDIWYSVS